MCPSQPVGDLIKGIRAFLLSLGLSQQPRLLQSQRRLIGEGGKEGNLFRSKNTVPFVNGVEDADALFMGFQGYQDSRIEAQLLDPLHSARKDARLVANTRQGQRFSIRHHMGRDTAALLNIDVVWSIAYDKISARGRRCPGHH